MDQKYVFLATLAPIFVSGCATIEPSPLEASMHVRTPFTLASPQLNEEIQTANPGDIVHRGEIGVTLAATLDAPFSANFDINDTGQYDVAEGTTLTAARVDGLDTFIYCTTVRINDTLNIWKSRSADLTCFLDQNLDSAFDHTYIGFGSLDWIEFTIARIYSGAPLDTPIPYTFIETTSLDPTDVVVRYDTAPLEGYYFVPLAQDRMGNLRPVEGALDSSRYVQRNEELPQTIRVMNVEIDILSFDNGEITYTVRRNENFDADQIISVD